MGNPHSKPEDRLHYISREVNSLRSSIRNSRQNLSKDKKEAIIETLANQSSEISHFQGKVKQKKLDEALKNLSEAMEEVLKIEPRDLDSAAVETDSFVHMPARQSMGSTGSIKSQKLNKRIQSAEPKATNRSSTPSIRDIEAKINDLRSQVNTAIDNRDTRQLKLYEKTIRVLAGDLEMIHVGAGTLLEQRKESIMKTLGKLYQKVTKSLKELNRDDNIQYLTKQSRKEKANNELNGIEYQLAENESLLDKMMKEKNSSNFATIRNNVVQINQRLTKVDIVDNDVKEKVVLLSQKLTETVKNLDKIMGRKEFDSKFSKALETYGRLIKNLTEDNVEVTKSNLENLKDLVQNLEEVSDTTKNRKMELLANINKQLNVLEEINRKKKDKETIRQIVEDNVILRKKIKSTDKEYTVIDQFVNYWNNIRSNFDINSYSNLSLLRLDGVLEEMQVSINDIRLGIANKCDTYPPSNLSKKQSQSVPKLNSKRKSYGSNKSLDQLDSQIIKAKAKLYNISTPQIASIENDQQTGVNNRFSKIEEIKMQVYYIKEKIDDSHNKNLLKNKLEEYLQNLSVYTNDPNKTVANVAINVSNEITELLHRLVIVEFKERVDLLSKKVQNFNGTRYEKAYDEIREDLLKTQVSLENFNIPPQFENLQLERDQLQEEIYYGLESLQEKSTYYRYEDDNVKQFKAKLMNLNERVKRFSGTYKGVHYNQIERDLNKFLIDIGERIENQVSANELMKDTERLLKILEQRASLAQSFKLPKPEETSTEDKIGITKIKNDLLNIKKEIDKTPDENTDALIALQSRLDLVHLELSQAVVKPNENFEKEREIFASEAQTLKNVVDAKIALGQQPLVPWPDRDIESDTKNYPKNDVNKEIEKFESQFQQIKREVEEPTSQDDLHKYYKLAQDLKKLITKLEPYKFIKGTDLHIRKTTIMEEMQYYVVALEKEAKDADYMISIEKNLDKLENLIDNNQFNDLKDMAKELQGIQSRLEKHKFTTTNENLRVRKTSVKQKTDDLAQKLKQIENIEQENKSKKLLEDTKKLDAIEEKVRVLRPEVNSFVGLQSDSKFYELDEFTMRQILILDKFDTDNTELHKRKMKLLKELHQFGNILDERAQQTQDVIELETTLEEIYSMIQRFSGSEEEITLIKERMEKTRKQLQIIKVNNDLVARKNGCVERFSVLFNKMLTLNSNLNVQSSNFIRAEQSSGYSSKASSNNTTLIDNRFTGYTTRTYNFVTEKTENSSQNIDAVLSKIEEDLDQLKVAVESTTEKEKLDTFDDMLNKYTIQLGYLNCPKESPQENKKLELFEIIEQLTEKIEEVSCQKEKIEEIEKAVNEVAIKMEIPLTNDEIDQLDEQLIGLQIKLGKINDKSLKTRVDSCMLGIILYLKNISDYKQSIKNTAV